MIKKKKCYCQHAVTKKSVIKSFNHQKNAISNYNNINKVVIESISITTCD